MIHPLDVAVHAKDYDCTPVCHTLLKPMPEIFGLAHMKCSLAQLAKTFNQYFYFDSFYTVCKEENCISCLGLPQRKSSDEGLLDKLVSNFMLIQSNHSGHAFLSIAN